MALDTPSLMSETRWLFKDVGYGMVTVVGPQEDTRMKLGRKRSLRSRDLVGVIPRHAGPQGQHPRLVQRQKQE